MRLRTKILLFLVLIQIQIIIPTTIPIQSHSNQLSIPQPPENLSASTINNKVVLQWSQPISNGGSTITGYNIYRSSNDQQFVLIGTTALLTFQDTNVSNGAIYYYIVRAVTSIAMSNPSNTIAIKIQFYTPTSAYINKFILYSTYLIILLALVLAIGFGYFFLRFEKSDQQDFTKHNSFFSFIKGRTKFKGKSKVKPISIHTTDKALGMIEQILEESQEK